LAAAESSAQTSVARVRALDPNWRPTRGSYETTEGLIRNIEAQAREAQARFDQLRSGIGGNFGPPLTPASGARAESFDSRAWIVAYRAAHTGRDMYGHPTGLRERDTVAVAEFDGRPIFGVNSGAVTHTSTDRIVAARTVDALVHKYPHIMSTGNVGRKPNDALYHAEATILLRAARASGGTLAGRTIRVEVDGEMCASCTPVLPKLGLELGNPTVTYFDPAGVILTMRNGRWID
jgi:hypothetical protein